MNREPPSVTSRQTDTETDTDTDGGRRATVARSGDP
jgi:hypothetical protein